MQPMAARRDRLPLAIVAAAVVGVVISCVVWMQNTIVSFDDWNFVLDRRGGTPTYIPNEADQWLSPHNGHPVILLVGIYRLVGRLAHYSYPLLVGIAALFHGAVTLSLYIYARRRVGGWPALVPALLVAFLGRGAPIVLSPIVMAFTIALAAGITAMNMIDGRADDKPPTIAVGIANLVAVAASGLGLARVVTVGVDRVARLRSIRDMRASWRWAVAVGGPLLMFVVWYLNESDGRRDAAALRSSVTFAGQIVASGTAGLMGLPSRGSTAVAVIAAGALLAMIVRRRRHLDGARLVAVVAGLVVDVGLMSWGRAGNALPDSGRYLYVIGVQVALLTTEALRGWRVPTHVRGLAAPLAGIGLLAAVAGGAGPFRTTLNDFRTDNHRTRVALSAFLRAEAAGIAFDPAFQPDPEFAPQVSASRLLGLVRDSMSPIGTTVSRPRTENERRLVDYFDALVFIREQDGANTTATDDSAFNFSGAPPNVVDSVDVVPETKGSCTTFKVIGAAASIDIQFPLTGEQWTVRATGPTTVNARSRAEELSSRDLVALTGPGYVSMAIPDRSVVRGARPWIARIRPSADVITCRI
jgi:hypothetical protein